MPPTNRRDRYPSDSANFATEQERIQDDNENSFRALLIGLILALLFGGGITALFLFNKKKEVPASVVSPIVVPSATLSPSPQPTTKETTIIREKTRELVPVPQATSEQPNINITIPDSKPVDRTPKSEAPSTETTTQSPASTAPQQNATPDAQSPPSQ